jgi:hypothetical protein
MNVGCNRCWKQSLGNVEMSQDVICPKADHLYYSKDKPEKAK